MPDLATDVDGPLAPLVDYYLWKMSRVPADEEYAEHRGAAFRPQNLEHACEVRGDLREACVRETAPRVEVADREYPMLWQPEDSPAVRSLERRLAAAFRPGGMEREAAVRAILSECMLLSPRLVSIGWSRIRAAATEPTAGDDDEEARRMGRALGTVLKRARDEAERRMAALRRTRDEATRSAAGQAAGT